MVLSTLFGAISNYKYSYPDNSPRYMLIESHDPLSNLRTSLRQCIWSQGSPNEFIPQRLQVYATSYLIETIAALVHSSVSKPKPRHKALRRH